MSYWVFDGDDWHHFRWRPQADAAARKSIEAYADMCDPEWPDSVESISIYAAPEECKYPDEDGECLAVATPVNIRPDETGLVDHWCDYEMAPPRALNTEEREDER